ncbi:GNAT family N-acetyltransferase [Microbacterium saperdae]|uniref:RimJ/RimL family protein N-acetyltransferase n=1 Tax=Microbacterium saperdae TaxID=69368 RepID=A0A543BNE3_9MICO|nr:GNAT family N-acetyltransferase [Microbacterium saperdae]TQL86350.1 RimJ/RimL family protein N-acetyltransferase [Microbacterium saperdae]GGM48679.1 acetyltransferase [Microbacterium saperdae]
MKAAKRLLPPPTDRLRFREMTSDDLDRMAALLGDPDVMSYYPAPRSREESADWIARMQRSYDQHGHGLWIIETHDGEFVGDCGVTWQSFNDTPVLEVGYHVRAALQRRGYATEAALVCRELVRREFSPTLLTAIIHPANDASRGVAEKLGMTHIDDDRAHPWIVRTVMGMQLEAEPET